MDILQRRVGGVTVLDITGPITIGPGAERLGDNVRSVLQQGDKQILVNLANVPYMDSGGLGELVQAYATTERQGGRLKLMNVTRRLNDLLVITKLSTVFESHDSEAAAIGSFQQPLEI